MQHIIDGQQRTTTLILLLKAFYNKAYKDKSKKQATQWACSNLVCGIGTTLVASPITKNAPKQSSGD
ncbi:DUF262 domain-containing protein [Helicobacter gastrocanis]|uniref:DUF262 domain-containing protein n=1 Tax=Helicobacter gastrocanis TaxID=2849641 RepID=UPI001C8654CC|nr:DUF262 domain-containing protein [Helicobacter sp. NHP19-003]